MLVLLLLRAQDHHRVGLEQGAIDLAERLRRLAGLEGHVQVAQGGPQRLQGRVCARDVRRREDGQRAARAENVIELAHEEWQRVVEADE